MSEPLLRLIKTIALTRGTFAGKVMSLLLNMLSRLDITFLPKELLLLLLSGFSHVRPNRWQPTRLPCPWDSLGKDTGVVAISFSNAWKWKWKWSRSVLSDSLWPHGLQPTRLRCPWDPPVKSTGVGCHGPRSKSLLISWLQSPSAVILEPPK